MASYAEQERRRQWRRAKYGFTKLVKREAQTHPISKGCFDCGITGTAREIDHALAIDFWPYMADKESMRAAENAVARCVICHTRKRSYDDATHIRIKRMLVKGESRDTIRAYITKRTTEYVARLVTDEDGDKLRKWHYDAMRNWRRILSRLGTGERKWHRDMPEDSEQGEEFRLVWQVLEYAKRGKEHVDFEAAQETLAYYCEALNVPKI